MAWMKGLVIGSWIACLTLLCQCASKHQPSEFTPYFPLRPESQLALSHLWERRDLEERKGADGLNDFQAKRLWELYSIELKSLKKGVPRYAEVSRSMEELASDVDDLEEDVAEVAQENLRYRDPSAQTAAKVAFKDPQVRKLYTEAQSLWNKDNNDVAFRKVNEVLAAYSGKLPGPEWYRLQSLRFRIALDIADIAAAEQSYQVMREIEPCSTESAQAGHLVALHSFARKDHLRALKIFDGQCDPDQSPANGIKRLYWRARFSEPEGKGISQKLYEDLFRSKMPGYYVYLAKSRLGKTISLPATNPDPKARPYLHLEFSVPRRVGSLFSTAEDRLRSNLRKDAAVYLTRAAQILKSEVSEEHFPALLYCAHLLQAAGAHLEAMKIYAVITTALQEDSAAVQALDMDFLREMFPRPFGPSVEWLSRLWGTDPDFIYAIMRQESAFNPAAVSPADARGLMQLMPFLARSLSQKWGYETYYSDKLLFNAEENLKLATFHLHQLRELAPHLVLMTASYNAGLSRVSGWWRKYGMLPLDIFVEVIPVHETRNYVKLVMRNYFYYKALRLGGALDAKLLPSQLPPPPLAPAAE